MMSMAQAYMYYSQETLVLRIVFVNIFPPLCHNCANVSGQRVLHQLLCHGLAKHGVLLVQVVVSLAFHQYCQHGQRL